VYILAAVLGGVELSNAAAAAYSYSAACIRDAYGIIACKKPDGKSLLSKILYSTNIGLEILVLF
jgi:hypothetical protein